LIYPILCAEKSEVSAVLKKLHLTVIKINVMLI